MFNEPVVLTAEELAQRNQALIEAVKSTEVVGLGQVVLNLITQGASVNAVDPDSGMAPLAIASRNGHREVAVMLLTRGAVLEALDNNNLTALFHAVANNRNSITQDLINANANVNVVGPNEYTPLMLASFNGNEEIAKDLVDANAKIDATNDVRDTSLILAAKTSQLETINFLIGAGADVNKENSAGRAALQCVLESNIETPLRNEIISTMFQSVLTSKNVSEESREQFLGQLNEDIIRDNLDRETASILAIIIPQNESGSSVVTTFNESVNSSEPARPNCLSFLLSFLRVAEENPAKSKISEDVGGKIDMLRRVRVSLEEGLEELREKQTPDAAASNNSETLANMVIIDLVKNPEKLKILRNYIEATPRISEISGPLNEQMIANKHLTNDQNYVFEKVMRGVIASKENRNPSPNLDTENISTAAVGRGSDDRGHSA